MKYEEFFRYDRLTMAGTMLMQANETCMKLLITMGEEHSKLAELLIEASNAIHSASREVDRLIYDERDELINFMKQ